jgi:hypothetical protein
VLGRQWQGLAQAEAVGLRQPRRGAPAFALVGDEQHRPLAAAQPVGEVLVERRHAGARIDQKKNQVGVLERPFGLPAHACRQAVVEDLLQASRIDRLERQIV